MGKETKLHTKLSFLSSGSQPLSRIRDTGSAEIPSLALLHPPFLPPCGIISTQDTNMPALTSFSRPQVPLWPHPFSASLPGDTPSIFTFTATSVSSASIHSSHDSTEMVHKVNKGLGVQSIFNNGKPWGLARSTLLGPRCLL